MYQSLVSNLPTYGTDNKFVEKNHFANGTNFLIVRNLVRARPLRIRTNRNTIPVHHIVTYVDLLMESVRVTSRGMGIVGNFPQWSGRAPRRAGGRWKTRQNPRKTCHIPVICCDYLRETVTSGLRERPNETKKSAGAPRPLYPFP